jgi:sulfur-oxidizing protein SoxA
MKSSVLKLLLAVLTIIGLTSLLIVSVSAGTDNNVKQIKEYTPSVSPEEYERRYKEFYGDATEKMAEEGNPGELMLDDGEELFHTVEGSKGKSCASCHGEKGKSLVGAATTFPKYDPELKGIKTLALQINICREKAMGAKPLKYESYDQLALELYVKSLSNGMPINVSIDGPARPFYEKGKAFYYKRQGQFNFNCAICHVKYAGYMARANLISNNRHHADHWPSYRLKWGDVGSLQRRFRGCMKNTRTKPLPYQSEEYRNLELYLTYISNGLPIQVPGFRM